MYKILAKLGVESKVSVSDIPLVREFLKVFAKVFSLPPKREIKHDCA